jgi:hypothetical protein
MLGPLKQLIRHICSVRQRDGFTTLVFRLATPHPPGAPWLLALCRLPSGFGQDQYT